MDLAVNIQHLLCTRGAGMEQSASVELYVGISDLPGSSQAEVAIAIRDTVYLVDVVYPTIPDGSPDEIQDAIIEHLRAYEHGNAAKFVGAGVQESLIHHLPSLCSRLWHELDVIPIAIPNRDGDGGYEKRIDERADSMARKCITYFGPAGISTLQVARHSEVQVAANGRIRLNTAQDYQRACTRASWETLQFQARKLHETGAKVAFFSATTQGGGVALMRHSLIRLSQLLGLDVKWYVPKPRSHVFRITKNLHNVLQGVSALDHAITFEDLATIIKWNTDNAKRYWLVQGGPLQAPEEGGADVIIVDDPQMIGLVPIAKSISKQRPVLFRSHIQIRSDLIATQGTPQRRVWEFIWATIKNADAFICHPIPSFIPQSVTPKKIFYLPATTDWLDGLNKGLNHWDTAYYIHTYNNHCYAQHMTGLDWPNRKYIIQVGRFDPAKGIPTAIEAYAEFRRLLRETGVAAPQLIICGNGSIDDPNGTMVYNEACDLIQSKYPSLQRDISVMRLGPNDQLLNALLSNAHIVLQLSIAEGFEVKVSEALRASRPVIATKAGGIPLQIRDKLNGFLVEPGDWKTVAGFLMALFMDSKLYADMSTAAGTSVSDEVSTVGNALAWYSLVNRFIEGPVEGNHQWVSDVAREEAGKPYAEGESRLPRSFTQV
ncbi:hypothetical protein MY3296_007039 [Beauveria thailandica]